MDRLTKKGAYSDYVRKDNVTAVEVEQKLGVYEDLEERLEEVYGECDGLLEMAVNHLVKIAPETKPHKVRLLTDETVDEWDEYKSKKQDGKLLELPIGIGEPCWVIEKCSCGIHYSCKSNRKADSRRKGEIIEGEDTGENIRACHNCVKIFERPFKAYYLSSVGKKVFASHEEAVKQAKELLGV